MKRERCAARVLVLAPIFSPCPHSPAQRLSSFVKALQKQHSDALVITCSRCLSHVKEGSPSDNTMIYDFECPRFLLSSSFVILNPVILLLYLIMSLVMVARKRFDAILASVPAGETAVVGFLLSRLFNIPLVIDIRDMYPPPSDGLAYLRTPLQLNNLFIRFFDIFYEGSDRLVCVDEDIKRRLVDFGIPSDKVVIIPNGANASVYKPCSSRDCERIRLKFGLPLERFIFVYAGALAWYYPVIEVAKGLKKLFPERKNFELLIISHVDYVHEKKMIEELGLEGCVRFMGPLPSAEAAAVTSACDVGVVVYRGEPYWKGMYGSKIFSYMSCGLPVLASGPPGSVIQKLLQEHKTGFFVGPPDEKHFAKGLSFFLDNRNEVKIMGENARNVVERFYDRGRLGVKLASLVDELLMGNAL
jgi:glycosyltransferase involved in cell wall biosynthesis